MTSREFKPPTHQHRALRFLVGCAILFVILVVAAIAAGTYLFTAPASHFHDDEEHHDDEVISSRRGERSFFEVQGEDEERIFASIELALGHVSTAIAERGALFQAEGLVESDQLRPRFNHDSDGREAQVSLSLDGENVSFQGLRGTRGSQWQLYFSDSTPLDLNLTLGAAQGDLNFTGVPLENLTLECGMASGSLRFDEPNPIVMQRMNIAAGLSEFTATGLGNARFEAFSFDGGAGDFTLDFSGESFMAGAEVEVNIGVASLTILLPSSQAVLIAAPVSFMTKVNMPASFDRIERDTWASPGAAGSANALRIEIDAGPGSIDVKLIE